MTHISIRSIQFFLIFCLCVFSAVKSNACLEDKIYIKAYSGVVVFSLELAKTLSEKQKGLMGREKLNERSGMLFLYDKPHQVAFWMKNTIIPLDIIFISSSGKINHIHHNAKPFSTRSISGGFDILVVLEINGGMAKLEGIKIGDIVKHPFFSQFDPIWPCEFKD